MSLGASGEERVPDATANLRALAHPVRLRILSLLTAASMTAAEVARELNLTHANASYHLRQLHASGVLDVAGEERIRGGVAKRYRYDAIRDLEHPPVPPADAASGPDPRLIYAALATELRRRSALLRRGPSNLLADAEFWVDPDVWQEIRDAVADAAARLHRCALPPRSPGAVRVSATLALFRMED